MESAYNVRVASPLKTQCANHPHVTFLFVYNLMRIKHNAQLVPTGLFWIMDAVLRLIRCVWLGMIRLGFVWNVIKGIWLILVIIRNV